MDYKILEALEYLRDFFTAKITTVARTFDIPRQIFQNRLKGIDSKNRPLFSQRKLLPAKKQAICNYINRLNQINLSITAKFIKDATNTVISERFTPSNLIELVSKK
ncbi:hypothetical protein F4825DRAFT_412270 [Nemania diffusa]|nr:hypothetical protein F4825DRAFT_412270 [Nemania diffusa]